MSNPNLNQNLKSDWVESDIVMPVNMNDIGENVNNLNAVIPIYSASGNFYTIDSIQNSVYNVKPLEFEDESQNVCPTSYFEGMQVCFKLQQDSIANCKVNVNNLGIKQIKKPDNTELVTGYLSAGYYMTLRFDSSQDCFYVMIIPTTDCVKLTGTQTITGVKTFTGSSLTNMPLILNNTTATPGIKFTTAGELNGLLGIHTNHSPVFSLTGQTIDNSLVRSAWGSALGSETKPVYIDSSGVAHSCTYEHMPIIKSITTATDFNTLQTSGWYYIKYTPSTADEVHAPTTNWGRLFVNGDAAKTQYFFPDSANNIYVRTYTSSAWQPWKKIPFSTEVLGLTGDQTVAGNKTFSGTVVLSKTTDAAGTSNNSPALIVGGTATQSHLELDGNEIMAKASATTTSHLNINYDGSDVVVNGSVASNKVVLGNHRIELGGKATMNYNSTTEALEFTFS